MARNKYENAIKWIAVNDESGSGDSLKEISHYISVCLIADIFEISVEEVAVDVVRVRRKLKLPVGRDVPLNPA
jgi:hypothetical protein